MTSLVGADVPRGRAGEDRRAEVFARLEENLNALASLRDELQLTIPLAYVEAVPGP